ncbi:helicase SNF2 [Falsihalocynthiibacter arcticus]|uniref:Helicase SNF2 n=1 Tax=Falsihalocynthiibacter arcticus TaxID=1579316 RepID=A0A126V5S5_9RHOB|nr:helicase SNF2 [Falsihalocynthiibacter arcticus]
MTPLLASGRVRRLLVLTPARLAPQWRSRLKSMFDIRLQEFSADLDRGKLSFWDTASQVVASFHTLRNEKALDRLLSAEPWDLVIVDEAHHFQAKQRASTITYQLLEKLESANRIQSLILFTGTPHRGKDYGFFALMQLVRPDLFDPKKSVEIQLPKLREAMIRNNKELATDLRGEKLFYPVATKSVDFRYSEGEQTFYDTMSEFIMDGRAYALSLSGREQTARMLLLIALQKLAASSIAAIRSALEKRRATLAGLIQETLGQYPDNEDLTLDEIAEQEESRPEKMTALLLKDEIARLDDLITLARNVDTETKVERLTDMLREDFPVGEPVLFFTEYKATQALLYNALETMFGIECVGFINGEDRLTIQDHEGNGSRILNLERDAAADDFNSGKTRFLISTEAGGEGIDLQERCAVLIHVDLPWNPMRLHQRVGRLNRYGQKRPVSVFLMKNPETVEARIWGLLQEKLSKIQAAISSVMEDDEDISQIVIGMTPPGFFDEVFSESPQRSNEELKDWFDAKTSSFGGRDAVATVRDLLGNVSRYDFQAVGSELPKVDLPDLENFFRNAMHVYGRRITRDENGLVVKTPEDWRRDPDLRARYEGLHLDRNRGAGEHVSTVMGVGHALFDRTLKETAIFDSHVARTRGLSAPLILVRIEDEVTGTGATTHSIVLGLKCDELEPVILRDWQLLIELNKLKPETEKGHPATGFEQNAIDNAWQSFVTNIDDMPLDFRRPKATLSLVLLPSHPEQDTDSK